MMKRFKMDKSKKGITLVESIFAVVILGILTIGIVALLASGGAKIIQISNEANAHAQAVQKMDQLIAAISNGCGVVKTEANGAVSYSLIIKDAIVDPNAPTEPDAENPQVGLITSLGFENVEIAEPTPTYHLDGTLRGWYLSLTYHGVTVNGFASNSKGAFD